MKVEIEEVKNNQKLLTKYNRTVAYGIPASTNTRNPIYVTRTKKGKNGRIYTRKELVAGGMGNAEILAIMEAGSPAKNIPSRELLEPVRIKYSKKIDEYFEKIMDALVEGDTFEVNRLMNELALRVESWTKKFFTDPDNGWQPNAPSTIAKKGSDMPLIDTASLRGSIRGIVMKR